MDGVHFKGLPAYGEGLDADGKPDVVWGGFREFEADVLCGY